MRDHGSTSHPKRRDIAGKTITGSKFGQHDQNMEDVNPFIGKYLSSLLFTCGSRFLGYYSLTNSSGGSRNI